MGYLEERDEMVATIKKPENPVNLVVTGEAEDWLPAIEQIIGPKTLVTYKVSGNRELLDIVRSGLADAAVLDDVVSWELDVLRLLRMIRRISTVLPVVVVTKRKDRRILEDAMRLAAFSVVAKPLELEELLRQIQRMMVRLDRMLRGDMEF